MSSFYYNFTQLFLKSLNHYYPDNFDHEIRTQSFKTRFRFLFEKALHKIVTTIAPSYSLSLISKNNYYLSNLSGFADTYEIFEDLPSKEKFVEILCYKALGPTKVKLALNNNSYWEQRNEVDKCKQSEKLAINNFRDKYLSLYDLKDLNFDLKLYFVKNGVFVDFILEQYNYQNIIKVESDDIVIDAGGCWGDTALYFASLGAKSVFVFEFIPSNIEIMNKNISMNPKLSNRIKLVSNAVWNQSDVTISYFDKGPASRVDRAGVFNSETKTLTIDQLVINENLQNVDFIKMDIEGAEVQAIEGAANTIRKFKPKLAISVYHKPDDMIKIPLLLKSINPSYSFYLDYYTIVGDEIMLYAIDKQK